MNRWFLSKFVFGALLSVILFAGLVAVVGLAAPIQAAPQAESLDKWIIGNGGGVAGDGSVELTDVLGPTVIGESTASGVVLESGYRTSSDIPTAVDVVSFGATAPATSFVVITWETASELNLIGFNLYRGSSLAGPFSSVNPELIPAQGLGGVFGVVYTFTDLDVQPGESYFYFLEALHTDQPATRYDPVLAVVPTKILYLPLVGR